MVKVAFLTYLNDETVDGCQHAHVHVSLAPAVGGHTEVDHWFRDVVAEPQPERGPDAFGFDVPGTVAIDEATVALTLPDLDLHLELDGPLLPYFPPPNQAASPFLGTLPRPDATSHWFVHTLGTPAHYRLDGREGHGLLYAERGWSVRQAHGFAYLMAVSEPAKVVLTCGQPDDHTQVWGGRVLTSAHDLTFLPFAGGHEVTADLAPDDGRAEITLTRDDLVVRVTSRAAPGDFYDQITPSQTVFGAEHAVAKTMQARMTLEIGDEVVELPQSILEFGGVLHPA